MTLGAETSRIRRPSMSFQMLDHSLVANTQPRLWTAAEIVTDLWLDGADLSTIISLAGLVSQWNDKSGNNNHAVQSVVAEQPTTGTVTIGGLNTIDFDNVDDFMNLTSGITTTADYAVVGVSSRSVVAGNDQIFAGGAMGTGYPILWNGAGLFTRYDGFVSLGSKNVAGTHILAGIRDAANDTWINFDGEIVGTKVATTPPTLEITEVARFQDTLGTFKQEGPICEFVLTQDNSTDTIQKLEGSFAWKWDGGVAGVLVGQLPVTHPYKDAPPYV